MSYIGTTPAPQMTEVGTGSVETQDIQDGAVTAAKLAAGAAVPAQTGQSGKFLTTNGTAASWATVQTGVTITSVAYSGDDLAIDPASPLQCTLTGTGFVAGTVIYIDTVAATNSATAITVVSGTSITFTPPAGKAANNYNVWAVLPTGVMAVLVNGILYSGTPNWSSQSTSLAPANEVLNIQLTATGDTPLVYSLVSGTLPPGTTLSSTGLISGTATVEATYPNIVIRATDPQNQDASVTIQITISLTDPYFRYNTLLLSGNPTVTPFNSDASTNNYNISIFGDTKSDSFTPYSGAGYYSNYFDGNTDAFTVPANAAFNFNTGDFTVECWINLSASQTDRHIIGSADPYFGNGGWNLVALSTGLNVDGNGNSQAAFNYTWQYGVWYHLAVSRTGSNLYAYINGVSLGVNTITGNNTIRNNFNSTNGPVYVGCHPSYTAYGFNGYISNARVITGTGLYPNGTTFTPSTVPLTAVSGTSLLTCQNNRFIDNSSNNFAITVTGDAKVSALQPFTNPTNISTYGSAYFDGSGDYLKAPTGYLTGIGTGNFTVEGWWNFGDFTTRTTYFQRLWCFGTGLANNVCLNVDNSGNLVFRINDTIIASQSSGAMKLNSWNHIALVRSSGVITIYLNGVSVGSASNSTNISTQATSPFYIGSESDGAGGYFYGYQSNLRVTNTAVYTSAFTPPTTPLAAISGTSLLTTQSNGVVNNNGFKDSSSNNFSITRVGTATQGTFTPYGNNWSNYFDGSGDYLQVSSTPFDFSGGQDFTLEFFMYIPNGVSYGFIYQNYSTSSGITGQAINAGSTFVGFENWNGGDQSPTFSLTGTTIAGQWNHVALVRNGSGTNNISLYINGSRVQQGTLTSFTAPAQASTNIGARNYLGYKNYLTGYISNLRIVKGTGAALYSGATYTVPTAKLTAVTNTVLLISGSNWFIDSSTNNYAITRTGDVSVQRFSPFAPTSAYSTDVIGGSGYFGGNGDYLTTPSAGQFAPSGDFTISVWYYPTSTRAYQQIIGNFNGIASTVWIFEITGGTGITFYTNGVTARISGSGLAINAWNHLALARSGSTITGYVNGVSVGTYSQSGIFGSPTQSISIGRGGSSTAAADSGIGYIADVKLIDGLAVTTVPTAPQTATNGTQLLLSCTNAGILDRAMMRNFETVGNAQISTSVKKYGTGAIYFDGTADRLTTLPSPNLAFLSNDFTIEGWFYISSAGGIDMGMLQISTTSGGLVASQSNTIALAYNSNSWHAYYANTYANGMAAVRDTWTHVALVRSSGSLKMYVNGVYDSTFGTKTDTTVYTGQNICVGGYYSTAYLWNGYIDDLRITNGVARYTANFTPPEEHKGR